MRLTHGPWSLSAMAWAINAAIVAFNASLIVVMWYAVIEVARVDRQNTIDAAIERNDNLAIVLEQYVRRTLESTDAAMHYLINAHVRGLDIERATTGYAANNRAFTGLAVADEQGTVATTAYVDKPADPVRVADREHFLVHVRRDTGKLHVGKPVTDRITGKSSVPVTRRINKPDGSFGGVAMALIEPGRFVDVLDEARLRSLDTTALVGVDGITRARLRGTTVSSGEDIGRGQLFVEQARRSAGRFTSLGQLDGVPKFFSYRTLPDYPLISVIGTAQADVLAEHQRRKTVYFRFAALATALIVAFTLLAMFVLANQRRAAASLARSQARFLATFDQAAVGIAHTTLEGRYLDVNQKLCNLLGYSREELLARTFADITHPGDVTSSVEFRRNLLTGSNNIDQRPREKRYVRKDGSTVWCLVAPSIVRDEAGQPDYVATVIQDVSERKRAEDALKESRLLLDKTFESLDQAVFVLHIPSRTIIACNPATEKVFGYKRDEMLGRTSEFLFVNGDRYGEFGRMAIAGMDATGVFHTEFRMRRKDGSVFPTEHAVSEMRDGNGQRIGVVSVVRDVTERRRAETALRDYAERMRHLSQRLSEIEENERRNINRELHDRVGQNLSILNLSLGRLRSQALAPEASRKLLEDAQALAETTIRLVRNVMADLRPPALDDFGLLAALRNHVDAFTARAGLAVELTGKAIDPRPPLAVETALYRIAQEALNNVAKHANARRVEIALEQDAGSIRLSVIDDGAGFVDGGAAAPRASWGLNTMRERADAIGAALRIESAPGKGTRVTVEVAQGSAA